METARKQKKSDDAPAGGWTALIDDVLAGRWVNPESGKAVSVPYDSIVIAESLDGAEADLVAPLKLVGEILELPAHPRGDHVGPVCEQLPGLGPRRDRALLTLVRRDDGDGDVGHGSSW